MLINVNIGINMVQLCQQIIIWGDVFDNIADMDLNSNLPLIICMILSKLVSFTTP